MATDSIRVSAVIPVDADRIYRAMLDSQEHAAFTGLKASIEPWVGGKYMVGDGYIQGVTLELEPGRRIVQTWRASDFPPGSQDSRIEVWLEPVGGGTRVTIEHTEIPEGTGANYEQGWERYYFAPMRAYFQPAYSAAREAEAERPAAGKARRPAAKPRRKATARPKAKRAKKAARKTVKKAAKKTAKRARKKARKPARKATARRRPRKAARSARKRARRRAPAKRRAARRKSAGARRKKPARRRGHR